MSRGQIQVFKDNLDEARQPNATAWVTMLNKMTSNQYGHNAAAAGSAVSVGPPVSLSSLKKALLAQTYFQ